MVEWSTYGDICMGGGRGSITCVAFHAARDIACGEELTLHYGPAKHRDYDVGQPAPPVSRSVVRAVGEMPCVHLGTGYVRSDLFVSHE